MTNDTSSMTNFQFRFDMKLILKSLAGVALIFGLASRASGSSMILQLLPGSISNTPVIVRAEDAASGRHFTVFYKTNDALADKFLRATLEVRDADNGIAKCDIEKRWITGGVEFSFDIAPGFLEASKFTLVEMAHDGQQPMPGFDSYWFYARDFAANRTQATTPPGAGGVSPDIMKELPGRVMQLRPGTTGDQVWRQLGLAQYQHSLGGVGSPTQDRFWLNSSQEIELVFEDAAGRVAPGQSLADDRKLIRATLYKNGREIAASSK
jgi:hypothetical protein